MPRPSDIANLAAQLHAAKLVNLDTPASQFVSAEGLKHLNPSELAGWYVIGGEHYVVVCGMNMSRDAVVGPTVTPAAPG